MAARPQLPDGWSAAAFDEIDSTNTEAMRRAVSGEPGPLWITARQQTHGRGRSGRVWSSAAEGLAATLLFTPACDPSVLAQIALVAGVAAHQAVAEALPAASRDAVRLKWPNDVLIDRAKICGILVESTLLGQTAVVAVGTGINIRLPPALAGRDTTALADHGSTTTFEALATGLAGALQRWIATWQAGRQFAAVRQAWLERAGPVGEPLSVNAGGGRIEGTFAGLDEGGSLLLNTSSDGIRKFSFGDVALGVTRV